MILEKMQSIYVADLDIDGDQDIVAINRDWDGITSNDDVVWFENLDGNGNFSDWILISSEIEYGNDVLAVDLDNDSDLDVVFHFRF